MKVFINLSGHGYATVLEAIHRAIATVESSGLDLHVELTTHPIGADMIVCGLIKAEEMHRQHPDAMIGYISPSDAASRNEWSFTIWSDDPARSMLEQLQQLAKQAAEAVVHN